MFSIVLKVKIKMSLSLFFVTYRIKRYTIHSFTVLCIAHNLCIDELIISKLVSLLRLVAKIILYIL